MWCWASRFVGTVLFLAASIGGVEAQNTFLRNDATFAQIQAGDVAGGASLTVGTTTITGGTSGRILYDNAGVLGERVPSGTGTTVATTTGTLTSGDCVKIDASGNLIDSGAACGGGGTLVSIQVFTSSQTITIPATATKAAVYMCGGSGGSGGAGGVNPGASGGSGAGGYLFKYETAWTPGNTVVYTQGALGAAGAATPTAGGNGGASTLATGTQTITTLTANGSNGSAAAVTGSTSAGTAGGTATNGDWNAPAVSGGPGFLADLNAIAASAALGGFGGGGPSCAPGAAGTAGTGVAGNAGNPGRLTIWWFTWNLPAIANDNDPMRLAA